jgi:predicted nucleic acid-binding protein
MSDIPVAPVVYDTGALLAAERNDRRVLLLHYDSLQSNRRIVVPAPVLAQAWRGGSRQATLSILLKACEVEATSEGIAKAAGVLLGASGTSDAVDAIVVATALRLGAHVLTSHPHDLGKLADAANGVLKLVAV